MAGLLLGAFSPEQRCEGSLSHSMNRARFGQRSGVKVEHLTMYIALFQFSVLACSTHDAHAKQKIILDRIHLGGLASKSFWMTPFRNGMPCRLLRS